METLTAHATRILKHSWGVLIEFDIIDSMELFFNDFRTTTELWGRVKDIEKNGYVFDKSRLAELGG